MARVKYDPDELVGEFAPEENEGFYDGNEVTVGSPRLIEVWFIDPIYSDHEKAVEVFNRWQKRRKLPFDPDYEHVANVRATSVEQAWSDAQNDNGKWLYKSSTLARGTSSVRSASTCDVFIDRDNREAWMSTASGWLRLLTWRW